MKNILTEGELMRIVKRALAIGAIVLTSFTASATLMNVGGVEWDPDHAIDFFGAAGTIYQEIDIVTGALSGFGRVTALNGLGADDMCPGCELTFHFGGYTVSDADDVGNIIDAEIEYEGGWMKLWVDFTPDASASDPSQINLANTGDDGGANALWLSLVGHVMEDTETTFIGSTQPGGLAGFGALDVVGGGLGGLAAWHIDTNSAPFNPLFPLANGSKADIVFGSDFSSGPLVSPVGKIASYGTADFSGQSIPEPNTLAIFALGLLALAIGVRNKKA